jgi:hypothetical protein
MIAVDEIDIGITGRPEQDGSACSIADGGVSGRIVFSEICFDFDDAGAATRFSISDQNFTKKVAGDAAWTAREKRAREWPDRLNRS